MMVKIFTDRQNKYVGKYVIARSSGVFNIPQLTATKQVNSECFIISL